jgi:hypothetical protein
MSSLVVASCYGSAIAVSLALLWYFGARSWYWHLLSVCAALALGLTPLPPAWNAPQMTLAVGWVFLFLFVWGVVGPLFAFSHHHPHFRSHSR